VTFSIRSKSTFPLLEYLNLTHARAHTRTHMHTHSSLFLSPSLPLSPSFYNRPHTHTHTHKHKFFSLFLTQTTTHTTKHFTNTRIFLLTKHTHTHTLFFTLSFPSYLLSEIELHFHCQTITEHTPPHFARVQSELICIIQIF